MSLCVGEEEISLSLLFPFLFTSFRSCSLSLVERRFLSAAQATDQGEESVVLLVVVKEDYFSVSHVQFFGV